MIDFGGDGDFGDGCDGYYLEDSMMSCWQRRRRLLPLQLQQQQPKQHCAAVGRELPVVVDDDGVVVGPQQPLPRLEIGHCKRHSF